MSTLRSILIGILMAVGVQHGVAQVHLYDIMLWGDSIGQLRVEYTETPFDQRLDVRGDVVFRLFGKRQLQYKFDARYRDDNIYYATTENRMNGEVRSWSKLERKTKGYAFASEDKTEFIDTLKVPFTTLSLYFDEPIGRDHLFSERFGEFCAVKEVEPHSYEVALPNGRENIYSFKNGVCHEVKVDHPLATFYFRLRK